MNINDYKTKFYSLLESKHGKLLPIIEEQTQQPQSQQPQSQQPSSQQPSSQQPSSQQQSSGYQNYKNSLLYKSSLPNANVGINYKPKNQTSIVLPNITLGSQPGFLKLCTGQKCIEREIKACFGKHCMRLILSNVRFNSEGDLQAHLKPANKIAQGLLSLWPKKSMDSFVTPQGFINFTADGQQVKIAVQKIRQGIPNIQIPLGFGVYVLIV